MKKLLAITAAMLAMAFSSTSFAQFAKPDDAAKYRQSAMSMIGAHMGRIGGMVAGRVPFDAKVAQENADIAVSLSALRWAGFAAGGEGAALKNRAKPEIWKEQAKFKDFADKSHADLLKLQAAAKTGSLDNLKSAFGATGASCKACHDAYWTQ